MAVGDWHKEKLEEARKLSRGETSNSTLLPEEAGMITLQRISFMLLWLQTKFLCSLWFHAGIVERALSSDWIEFKEEIGLWIPISVVNREHDDKPEEGDEFGKA